MIPPGGYYSISRKPNRMIVEKDWSYGYIISFGIYEKFNKNGKTCNPNLDFAEDECKLNQVGFQYFIVSSIIDLFLVIEKTFGSFQLSHTMADTVYKECNVLSVVSGMVLTFLT